MIAEDSFESYPAGTTVLGLNGGSGWAGPWVGSAANTFNAVDTSANPLVFTPAGGNPIYGGGRAAEIAAVGNQTNSRALPSPLPDSFYAAYMVRVAAGQWTDTDTFSIHFANTPYNTGTPNFGLRGPGTFMIRIGTGAPAATNVLSGSTALGDVNYLVVRFSKLDGNGNPTPTYDRFELWLNPAVGDEVAFPNGQVRMQLAAGSGLPTFSHILVRVAALEAGDAVHLDQLILADSWAEVINPILPPSITDLTPTDGTTFWPGANGISFRASSTQPIDPVGIALVLNGTDVSAGLQIGGDPTLRMVFFDGLLPNTLYVAEVGVSNLTGSTKQTIRFDTFSDTEAVVVEVEDYNYELWGECDHVWGALRTGTGGTFQDNPLPSGYDLSTGQKIGSPQTGEGYVDAVGCPEVDYHDASNVAMNPVLSVYRYCDFVGTRLARDYRR